MTLLSRLFRRAPVLDVPPEFNRNSATVTALMPPEDAGRLLLEKMRTRIGFESYADKSLLDFGCGVRFSQAILNTKMPFGRYTGVDNFAPMIELLQRNVRDPRFRYHFLDAYHPLYNVAGNRLSATTTLPFDDGEFDVVAMFSVITHQYPADAEAIFTMLRRYASPRGHLFFTCFLDDTIEEFEDRSPEKNGGRCHYNARYLTSIVERCRWRVQNIAPAEGPLIADSFLCTPA